MKNSPSKTHKKRKSNGEYPSKDDPDTYVKRIKQLEIELSKKDQDLKYHEEKILDLNQRIHEITANKREVSNELGKLQLMQVELKLSDYQGLQDDYHKIKHRNQVTKKQLDKARVDIKVLEEDLKQLKKVVKDLEKRGFLDYLRGRFPESLNEYKKKNSF